MVAQPPGIAGVHIGGGTELVPDIAEIQMSQHTVAHLHLDSDTIAVNVRVLENFLKPHQTYPTLQF